MLKQLYIKDFTIIDEVSINFHPGFSVITGETGAGKSIILGAIGLLLGHRADTAMVRQNAKKCIIEAHFSLKAEHAQPTTAARITQVFDDNDIDFDPEDTIVRREVGSNGKSRAFINDSPVQLSLLKELGSMLIDIHSQHQNLLLNEQDFQLQVVDIIAHDNDELSNYLCAYNRWKELKKKLDDYKKELEQTRTNEEFIRYQFKELSDAQLRDGEQEELETQTASLSHSEEIKAALFTADSVLRDEDCGVTSKLHEAAAALHSIEEVYPQVKELAQRLDSSEIEVSDIASEVARDVENIDFDPAQLDTLNARLDLVYNLEKKYRCDDVFGLLQLQAQLEKELDNIDSSDSEIEQMEQQLKNSEAEASGLAAKLTAKRRLSAEKIEKELKTRLIPLGIPNVSFQIDIKPAGLTPTGADCVDFLFSANKGMPLQPISEVASGGEIARVMLSVKAMISGAVSLPTIIFDEIDTGVSGRIAEQMARIMQEMGHDGRQVISITHLPQIAAFGQYHYRVSKHDTQNGTISKMVELKPDERVKEIAQMLSGTDITSAALENARQLLAKN